MKLDCLYEAIKRNRNPSAAVKVDNDFVSCVSSSGSGHRHGESMTNITPQISKRGLLQFLLKSYTNKSYTNFNHLNFLPGIGK